ncbi:FecR family protein [Pedobacter mendelii]|uniref:Iron dicitrate transporter FecR n=1 Tax=Pedobacter mendelii TaxID=1908240 RepID=A0ABQ2BH12_9SPHI|nr:FecR domain-containing protein [Pedobacter mendelii]GGI23677.1 iron dicitrate transporter FecR [Pedobacter mendelii]
MDKQEITHILDKFKAGKASDEEVALLESWYLKFETSESEILSEEERLDTFQRVGANLNINSKGKKAIALWQSISIAAVLFLMVSIGLILFKNQPVNDAQIVQNDVAPGGNNAFLTLTNGKRIDLSKAENGEIAEQAGIKVSKLANGQLIYKISSSATKLSVVNYNTIETPRGGTYMVILPDGSKVWLNAESSLNYPTAFEEKKQRKVHLKGEAYFEVAHDASSPFMVETDNQTVEVLGTHFNVNAYNDEQSVSTTLLQGSVRINAGLAHLLIKPGQQSVLTQQKLKVLPADVDDVIAWKNGLFQFSDENLESVMRKISRWYDVEIEYTDENIKEIPLTGIITHFTKVSKVLRMLELTKQVRFKIEGKKIIVSK